MANGCWRYEAIVILSDAWDTLRANGRGIAAEIIYNMIEDEYAIGMDCGISKNQRCYCETQRRRMGSPVILNINGERVQKTVEIAREEVEAAAVMALADFYSDDPDDYDRPLDDPGDGGYWFTE